MPQGSERKTLREFGFEECQHPLGSLAYETGPQHCPLCGATRIGQVYSHGSVDYRFDTVIVANKEIMDKLHGNVKN